MSMPEKERLGSETKAQRDEVNDYWTESTTGDARRESPSAIQYHDRGTIFASWRAFSELLNTQTTSSEMSRYASGEQFRNASRLLLIKGAESASRRILTPFDKKKKAKEQKSDRERSAFFAVFVASRLRPLVSFFSADAEKRTKGSAAKTLASVGGVA
jgi:hypothetical protein